MGTGRMPDVFNTIAAGRRGLGLSALAVVATLVAGCANRDSIKVGSVPDDYRTNHPIVVAERDKTVDIPVGVGDSGLSRVQRVAVEGFIAGYDRSAAPMVTVMAPYGSGNQAAAGIVASELVVYLRKAGVPESRISHQSYEASQYGAGAPIRLIYSEMVAQTGQCGRWPDDMLANSENKHWANFGCAYQNNLAAQIANPADLLGPRKPAEVDTERRTIIIDDYRAKESAWEPTINY